MSLRLWVNNRMCCLWHSLRLKDNHFRKISDFGTMKENFFFQKTRLTISIFSGNATFSANDHNCSLILDETSPVIEEREDVRLNCILQAILPRWLNELQSCKEDFPRHGRLIYSSITMVIQYLLPTITISVAYYQVRVQSKGFWLKSTYSFMKFILKRLSQHLQFLKLNDWK